jgi:hypothetical protein
VLTSGTDGKSTYRDILALNDILHDSYQITGCCHVGLDELQCDLRRSNKGYDATSKSPVCHPGPCLASNSFGDLSGRPFNQFYLHRNWGWFFQLLNIYTSHEIWEALSFFHGTYTAMVVLTSHCLQ